MSETNEAARKLLLLDSHDRLTRELREAQEQSRKRMLALESLTPGGSEFVGDVKACVAFVRQAHEDEHRRLGQQVREVSDLRARSVGLLDLAAAVSQTVYGGEHGWEGREKTRGGDIAHLRADLFSWAKRLRERVADLRAQLADAHCLLQDAHAAVDPETRPEVAKRLGGALEACDLPRCTHYAELEAQLAELQRENERLQQTLKLHEGPHVTMTTERADELEKTEAARAAERGRREGLERALGEAVERAVRKPNDRYRYSRCNICGSPWWDREEHRRDCPVPRWQALRAPEPQPSRDRE